jgi:hypothetical protein
MSGNPTAKRWPKTIPTLLGRAVAVILWLAVL